MINQLYGTSPINHAIGTGADALIVDANKARLADVLRLMGVKQEKGGAFACPAKCGHDPTGTLLGGSRWRCSKCDAGGSVVDLVAKHKGLSEANAARWVLRMPLASSPMIEVSAFQSSEDSLHKETAAIAGNDAAEERTCSMSDPITGASVRPRRSSSLPKLKIVKGDSSGRKAGFDALKANLPAVRDFLLGHTTPSEEHEGYRNCPLCGKHKLNLLGHAWECHTGGCHEGHGHKGDLIGLVEAMELIDECIAEVAGKPAGLNSRASQNGKTKSPPTVHATADKAISALLWSVEQKYGKGWHVAGDGWTPYHDAAGNVAFGVVRFERIDENGKRKKEPRQFMPADGGWISKGMPKNRPLYDLLTLDKSLPLVIVEGEKACVAAREIGLHATTWAGGSGAVDKTDWSTLAGFDVIVWPDADEPGRKAARQIAKTLHGVAARVRILPDDPDAADGDDAADVLDAMGQEKALEHFRDRLELAIDWTPPQPATSGFPQPGNGKPRVIFPLNYNDPSMIFEQVIPHLANAGVYYRDGSLCRIIQGDSVNIRGVSKLSVSGPMIDTHDADSILPVLCKAIDFQAEYWRGDVLDIKPITPRIEFIKWFLRLRKWQGTPFLAGVTSGPFLRHDGTVCTTPGYDAASGWYLDYDGEPIEVPDHPTKDQAKNACRELLALVDDFEWKSEAQSCGFLAHLMTLAARPGIEGPVPAFVFTASTLGAGKTLLANVANIITLGHAASIYSPPQARHESDSAEEWKKMLFAHAATGNPSLVVDNYPSGKPVGNAAIDGVISSTKMIGRPLQTSKVRESAWVAVMVFTGNNLSCTADFAPRSMWAVLEPTWENPRERTGFKIPDLDGYARKHRAELLGYALTILRWHAAEGKPKAGGKNAGTFEEWASTVRDPIMHLTGHDVTQNSRDAVITDQEADELGTLLGGLHEYFEWRKASGKPQPAFTVAELHGDLNDLNNASSWSGLREVVDASLSYRAFCTSVGRLLPKYRGRVSGGMKLIVTTVNRKHYWRIDVVNPSPLSERDRG